MRSNMDESEGADVVNIDENIQVAQLSPLTLRNPTTGYRQTTMDIGSARESSSRFLLTNQQQARANEDVLKRVRRRSIFDNDVQPVSGAKIVKIHHVFDDNKYIRPAKGTKKIGDGRSDWSSLILDFSVCFQLSVFREGVLEPNG